MPTAYLAALGSQQTSQHARTGEWVLQVQPIETMHDRQLRLRHRPRQVVDAATADVESFRLFADRQIVPAAPFSSCDFQIVIWLGCTSNCSASCAIVRSPLMAARATFALKAGVWFRRGRRFMVSPDSQAQRARCQAEIPLIAMCKIPEPLLDLCCTS
jgi:hypothetical protein